MSPLFDTRWTQRGWRGVPARWHRALPELTAAAVALLATVYVAGLAPWWGFPLDDAWIHMAYGLSLRRFGSLDYNDGIPATGASSPLWAFVACVAHVVVGAHAPSPHAATCLKAIGIACQTGVAVLAARLGRRCAPGAVLQAPLALAAGCLVATSPALAFAGASGMEVPAAALLILGTLLVAADERLVATGLLAGLASITRLEAIVVLGPAFALAHRRGLVPTRRVGVVVLSYGLGIVPCVCWTARNLAIDGRPLPSTVYAKTSLAGGLPGTFASTLRQALFNMLGQDGPMSIRGSWLLVAAALVVGAYGAVQWGLARCRGPLASSRLALGSTALTASLFIGGLCTTTRFTIPWLFYFERYLLPVLPLVIVAAIAGGAQIAFAMGPRLLRKPVRWSLFSIAALSVPDEASALGARRKAFGGDTRAVQAVQLAVGQFIDRELPADAVVWSVDAGAIRYFGQRRTVDLVQLNSPELLVGGQVLHDWWPDSIVIIPPYAFRVDGEAVDRLIDVRAPSRFDSGPTQTLYRCAAGRSGVVEVRRWDTLVAQGHCARSAAASH